MWLAFSTSLVFPRSDAVGMTVCPYEEPDYHHNEVSRYRGRLNTLDVSSSHSVI
jgi:hypothetical protein